MPDVSEAVMNMAYFSWKPHFIKVPQPQYYHIEGPRFLCMTLWGHTQTSQTEQVPLS